MSEEVKTSQSITVARALIDIKRINDRVETALESSQLFEGVIGIDNAKIDGKTQLSRFNKIKDLLDHRAKLKSALGLSNATTKISVPFFGTVTIAEAIELKKSIELHESTYKKILNVGFAVEGSVKKQNERCLNEINSNIRALSGGEKEVSDALRESIKEQIEKTNKAFFIDPNNLMEKARAKLEGIFDFKDSVDALINESNATTKIVVAG